MRSGWTPRSEGESGGGKIVEIYTSCICALIDAVCLDCTHDAMKYAGDIEVVFSHHETLGIAFSQQDGEIVVIDVAADSYAAVHADVRPGMVLCSIQGVYIDSASRTQSTKPEALFHEFTISLLLVGTSVTDMTLADAVALMSQSARPLALEFAEERVVPRTPTKLGGGSVISMTDAFFVAGLHLKPGAKLQMAQMATDFKDTGRWLLETAVTVGEIDEAAQCFTCALRLLGHDNDALTWLDWADFLRSEVGSSPENNSPSARLACDIADFENEIDRCV
eukprot:SAG31_NODE_295_length_18239_cov_15.063065_2_plen_279_part_00